MKISILLPYKENFSPVYAGAVSLFVKDTVKISKYKKNITVYGNTNIKNIYKLSYKNIFLKKNIIESGSKNYVYLPQYPVKGQTHHVCVTDAKTETALGDGEKNRDVTVRTYAHDTTTTDSTKPQDYLNGTSYGQVILNVETCDCITFVFSFTIF